MRKYRSLISDTIVFGIGNFTVKIVYFLLMPLYTLALSTEEFGIADLLTNTLALVMPILTLSISDAVFRFTIDKDCQPSALLSNGFKILSYSYLLVSFIALISFVLFELPNYWILFAIWYIFDSLKLLFAQYTRALGKVWHFSINGIIGSVVLLISTFIFVYLLNWGINGYLLSFIFADITSVFYLIWASPIICSIRNHFSNNILLKKMLLYSLPLIPNMLSWWLTNISSRYIIAAFCGLSVAGLFSAASKIPAILNIFTSIFQQSWQFASVKEYQESEKSSFFINVFNNYSFFCLLAYSSLTCIVPYISKIVLQGEFYQAWVYTPLLLFSALLGCYSTFVGTFYSVVKNNVKAMVSTFWGAFVNITLGIVLIYIWGIIGALISNIVSYFIIVIIRVKDIQGYIYFPVSKTRLFLLLAICLSQAIAFYVNIHLGYIISSFTIFFILFSHQHELANITKRISSTL